MNRHDRRQIQSELRRACRRRGVSPAAAEAQAISELRAELRSRPELAVKCACGRPARVYTAKRPGGAVRPVCEECVGGGA